MKLELKYRADQPRVSAGSPEGGRWTNDAGASAVDALDDGVFRPGALDNPTAELSAAKPLPVVDLRREELSGGHAIARHVGQSNAELVRRLDMEKIDTPTFFAAARKEGSFNDIDSANRYVNDVLASHPQEMADVTSGKQREVFLEKHFDEITGREAYRTNDLRRSPISIRLTHWAGVQVEHSPTGKRFLIRTAYPKNADRDY